MDFYRPRPEKRNYESDSDYHEKLRSWQIRDDERFEKILYGDQDRPASTRMDTDSIRAWIIALFGLSLLVSIYPGIVTFHRILDWNFTSMPWVNALTLIGSYGLLFFYLFRVVVSQYTPLLADVVDSYIVIVYPMIFLCIPYSLTMYFVDTFALTGGWIYVCCVLTFALFFLETRFCIFRWFYRLLLYVPSVTIRSFLLLLAIAYLTDPLLG